MTQSIGPAEHTASRHYENLLHKKGKHPRLSWSASLRFPAAVAAIQVEAKSENVPVLAISAHVKNPQVVKINPESSITTYLIVRVASER